MALVNAGLGLVSVVPGGAERGGAEDEQQFPRAA